MVELVVVFLIFKIARMKEYIVHNKTIRRASAISTYFNIYDN